MAAETTNPSNIERLQDELPDDSLAKRLVVTCAPRATDNDALNPKAVIEEQYRKHFDEIKNA